MALRLLLVNGPNLARLGSRRPEIYGAATLDDILATAGALCERSGWRLHHFQSESEADIIRFIDARRDSAALVINPGALMMSGWALRDCLEDFSALKIEIHISNVFAREAFRAQSVLAPVMHAMISGLGVDGYRLAIIHAIRVHANDVGAIDAPVENVNAAGRASVE